MGKLNKKDGSMKVSKLALSESDNGKNILIDDYEATIHTTTVPGAKEIIRDEICLYAQNSSGEEAELTMAIKDALGNVLMQRIRMIPGDNYPHGPFLYIERGEMMPGPPILLEGQYVTAYANIPGVKVIGYVNRIV